MTIIYDYFGGLYINLTNRCPNRCEFCIRNFTDSLGTADSLVLKRDPSVDEVKEELRRWDVNAYDEVIFCGYGEPTERLPELLELARHIKAAYGKPIRINTNGLADLIWERETAPDLAGVIDAVSISLNEADAESYERLCHPRVENRHQENSSKEAHVSSSTFIKARLRNSESLDTNNTPYCM